MNNRLSEAKIKAVKGGKAQKLTDGDGLELHVSATGVKTWRLRIRSNGKDTTITLGKYPSLSLKEARTERDRVRLRYMEEDEVGKEPSKTFHDVMHEWYMKNEAVWRGPTKATRRSLMVRFDEALGDMQIASITPSDILTKVIRPMEAEGVFSHAKHALCDIGLIMRYAVASQYIPSDPSRDLKGAMAKFVPGHVASVTDKVGAGDVIRKIRNATCNPITKAAVEFLLLTFVRPNNVLLAKWEQIDLDRKVWTIPAEEMKGNRQLEVPLSRQAMEVLERVRQYGTVYVFPSMSAKRWGGSITSVTLRNTLIAMGIDKDTLTPHGFRSMASSILNEADFDPDIIEKQLAHISADKVRGIYNRATYWQKRVEMMQAWADMVDEMERS